MKTFMLKHLHFLEIYILIQFYSHCFEISRTCGELDILHAYFLNVGAQQFYVHSVNFQCSRSGYMRIGLQICLKI